MDSMSSMIKSEGNQGGNNQGMKSSPSPSMHNIKNEPQLMPVPSPQHIQYLNAFDGQELTIQKQPNTSLRESELISPPDFDLSSFGNEFGGPMSGPIGPGHGGPFGGTNVQSDDGSIKSEPLSTTSEHEVQLPGNDDDGQWSTTGITTTVPRTSAKQYESVRW